MNKAIVRRAEFGDEEGIHNAHMTSIQEVCSKDYNEEQINAWGRREFNFESKRSLIKSQYVWVVDSGYSIEGYGLLFHNKNNDTFEFGSLYLTSKAMGLGLGADMVKRMKGLAKELGAKEILLVSTITSKNFYERQGFYQYEKDKCSFVGGIPIEGHPMKCEL